MPIPFIPANRAALDVALTAWFANATTSTAENGDISTWNVSAITDMLNLFSGRTTFNQPLNSWNVSNVTDMMSMFAGATAFNQPLNLWDVRKVTSMRSMFGNATSFDQNIRTWIIGRSTNLANMFLGATAMIARGAVATPPLTYFIELNTPPTGSVTITGTPMQNQVLVGSHNLADANGPAMPIFSYQWQSGGVPISGATTTTYRLVLDDVGKAITFIVSYTDSLAVIESKTSAATALVAAFVRLPTATRLQLDAAVTSWISDSTLSNLYGDISTWDISAITDMSNLFNGKGTFNGNISGWDVKHVTNMSGMLAGTAFNQPINSWNVGLVTNMKDMFYNAVTFNKPLNSWNTNQVTDMRTMFYGAASFNQDLSLWYVGQGTTLTNMFNGATSMLAAIPTGQGASINPVYTYFNKGPVNTPPTGSVSIAGTFRHKHVLTGSHNLVDANGPATPIFSYQWQSGGVPISGATASTYKLVLADIGKAITLTVSYMDGFGKIERKTSNATSLVGAYIPLPTSTRSDLDTAITAWISNATNAEDVYGDINTWNVSAITDMSLLFNYKSTFNSNISGWDVGNVTTMMWMFQGATAFNQPLNSWNVTQVTNTEKMFSGAIAFDQPLNLWNVGNVLHMTEMFNQARKFNQPLNSWNVSKVVSMSNMFVGATLFNQPLNSWSVISVANMSNMFCATPAFNQPLSSWNVSNVTEMGAMFSGATAFDQPLDSWNVSKVKNMTSMFQNNAIFNQPLSSWNVSQVTTMHNMFNGASAFDQIIRKWSVGQATILTTMFSGATKMLTNRGASITPLYTYFNQVNTPPTGSVTISGTSTQGQELTAITSELLDANGLGATFAYQWKRNGDIIPLATASTYTPVQADVGQAISVTVSYIDGIGVSESVTSAATPLVASTNDSPLGHVMISGGLTHGQELTASHTLTVGGTLGTVSHKWFKNGTEIDGAVGATYTSTSAVIGAKISVTVYYTDTQGLPQQKTSAETYPIQPARPGYSMSIKRHGSMTTSFPANGTIIIANGSGLATTTSNNATAFSIMTAAEKGALVAHNADLLLSKYASSLSSNTLHVLKSLLPFTLPSTHTASTVRLINGTLSSVASPLAHVGEPGAGAVYIHTVPGNSVTLTYSPDTLLVTHTSESAFTVSINGGAAVNKLTGDQIELQNVTIILGSITAVPPTNVTSENVNFVLPQLNASLELTETLSIAGEYTPPAAYALPTITLSMPVSEFNNGLFQFKLEDSHINTLVSPATEAMYVSEKITYYADDLKFPVLKNGPAVPVNPNVLLKDLPVVNGNVNASKTIRQREESNKQSLPESMIHELAFQLTGVSKMDDQLANGEALKTAIRTYLDSALPTFIKAQLGNCNGKTQNISGASDMTGRANVPRELFMQIVDSVVGGPNGGVNPSTGTAKSSRLNDLFDDPLNYDSVTERYGIKFIVGDTLRFSITISPYSVSGVVADVDVIVDGEPEPKQEARTVELVITMV